jgi:hydrogenase maturation protease
MRSRETDESCEATRRVLVIGYGNPVRGDDGLGQVIAERVAETARPEAIGVIVAHQLTPELVDPISRSDLVIFVDAAVDVPAGRIKVVPIIADAVEAPGALGHHCCPAQLLAAAKRLYAHSPEAWAIVVGGERWDYAESLSPAVEHLVPRLLHYIELLIAVRLPAEAGHA